MSSPNAEIENVENIVNVLDQQGAFAARQVCGGAVRHARRARHLPYNLPRNLTHPAYSDQQQHALQPQAGGPGAHLRRSTG